MNTEAQKGKGTISICCPDRNVSVHTTPDIVKVPGLLRCAESGISTGLETG